MIRHENGKFVLYSHSGKVLGKFKTKKEAMDREHEIKAAQMAKRKDMGH